MYKAGYAPEKEHDNFLSIKDIHWENEDEKKEKNVDEMAGKHFGFYSNQFSFSFVFSNT